MSKFIVGLTGGIGSGKSTITEMFIALGVDCVDADIIARQVVAKGTPALAHIIQHFGQDFLLADGELNRPLLRQRIFNHSADKKWLNDLLHPIIRNELHRQLMLCESPYCILIAPLLLENKLEKIVDCVLVVDVDVNCQIERTIKRDNSSVETVKNIIKSQISRADRLAKADDVIDNQLQDLKQVKKQVLVLHNRYLLAAKERTIT